MTPEGPERTILSHPSPSLPLALQTADCSIIRLADLSRRKERGWGEWGRCPSFTAVTPICQPFHIAELKGKTFVRDRKIKDRGQPCMVLLDPVSEGKRSYSALPRQEKLLTDPPCPGHTSSVRLSRGRNRTTGKDLADLPRARGRALFKREWGANRKASVFVLGLRLCDMELMAGNNPFMVLISSRNNKNQSPGSLNAELLTLLVRMGVHPKVFPDCMHTSVLGLRTVHMSSLRCLHKNQNLFSILSRVQIAPPKAVIELRQVLRVTQLLVFLAGMPIVPCDNYFWRKGWATRWAGALEPSVGGD
ncbi:hypothetical protein Bca101_036834 [Brassica carinata]